MKKPVYLDYAATTPVDPRVAEKMCQCLTLDGIFGNPASRSHRYGWQAEEAVDVARNHIAELVNADPREIVFTSGATESDNLAIKGVAYQHRNKACPEQGQHIVTVATEHKAVLDACAQLEQEGFEITYLKPKADGLLDLETFKAALRPDTLLASVMHVNNETGVIQDIAALGQICREHNVLFHVDAAQSTGKVAIDLQSLPVDLMSFSAHKSYGPKGIGALYVRRKPKIQIQALIHGGGHERGMRSGTLATHQIVGMGEAFAIAKEEMDGENARILALRERLWQGIKDIKGIQLNGSASARIAGNLNVSFDGVEGESLLMALTDIAVSSGSACNSASVAPSYVLTAMGIPDQLAHSAIRLSIGRFTTEEEVDFAIAHIRETLDKLQAMAINW
ncbi:IscS subfamily cysteine desulfurase [Aliiglaciecola sp. CAU 1673]|uniref:IscS subfamily cysteine desulfurase n=1 Tax=Aliiglaciecola sp. CAU 1673 TaxID=3032595 RepID=UPI0023DA3845|nr:IscS subfamily cysteine desulfurase [Aliiglaciecola sp. CAU 1673]MDF2178918.1 IscS subfamily cysteine desulfurase [Aliiglaciecola sp. CAU 1673]